MLWWTILICFSVLQDLQITECLNFNMRVLDYTYECTGGGFACRRYISTKIEFGDSTSRGCDVYPRHKYDCICCKIDTCRPKTCSCLHGRFSPETDSKLITNKTSGNESVATIWIAVHEKPEYIDNDPTIKSKFCVKLTLSPDGRLHQRQPDLKSKLSPDTKEDITLQFNVTSDVVTTTSTTEHISTVSSTTTSDIVTTTSDIVTTTSTTEHISTTSATTSSIHADTTQSSTGAKESVNIPAIIGGCIAGTLVIAATLVVYKWCKVRKKKERERRQEQLHLQQQERERQEDQERLKTRENRRQRKEKRMINKYQMSNQSSVSINTPE